MQQKGKQGGVSESRIERYTTQGIVNGTKQIEKTLLDIDITWTFRMREEGHHKDYHKIFNSEGVINDCNLIKQNQTSINKNLPFLREKSRNPSTTLNFVIRLYCRKQRLNVMVESYK